MSKELIIKKSVTLNAPIDKVWDVLTNPELTPKYMYGCALVSNWNVGDKINWELNGKVVVTGEIIKIVPGKHLHFTTFDPSMGLGDTSPNYIHVTYTLSANGSETVLEITQGDYQGAENAVQRYEDSVKGWDLVINDLKKVAES